MTLIHKYNKDINFFKKQPNFKNLIKNLEQRFKNLVKGVLEIVSLWCDAKNIKEKTSYN